MGKQMTANRPSRSLRSDIIRGAATDRANTSVRSNFNAVTGVLAWGYIPCVVGSNYIFVPTRITRTGYRVEILFYYLMDLGIQMGLFVLLVNLHKKSH